MHNQDDVGSQADMQPGHVRRSLLSRLREWVDAIDATAAESEASMLRRQVAELEKRIGPATGS